MNMPFVTIVGRPNVGKSTFFNKMVGRRMSIVDDFEGITRDRLYHDIEWCGNHFTLVDTGGIKFNPDEEIWGKIRDQIDIAIDLATIILFFVDGKQGITSDDRKIAEYLRKTGKRIILVVNKVDNNENDLIYDFYELGMDDLIGISSELSQGLGDLLDLIVETLPKISKQERSIHLNIAVVGKPNVGKSLTINKLLGYDRVIVHDMSGTTRDNIDTTFKYNNRNYNLIDTAGIRRKSKVNENVEYYSVMRSIAAIKRADVVLIVLDATEEISEQDVRICGLVHDDNKPSVILMNKWDLLSKDEKDIHKFNKILDNSLKFMNYRKTLFVSAQTTQRFNLIMQAVDEVNESANTNIKTAVLNQVIQEAVLANQPSFHKGRRLKIYYATQTGIKPPTFTLFVNDKTAMHFSYFRYLENYLRQAFGFVGTPIKLNLRNKKEEDIGD